MADLEKIDQPTLPMDRERDGQWRLARRSLPVVAGHEHNYLELTFVPAGGGKPELMGEIHGVNHDPVRNTYGVFTMGTDNNLVAMRTRANEHWGNDPTEKNIELVKGSYDDVVGRYWKDALDKSAEFNRKPARVYKYDQQNSNNFGRNLLGQIHLEDRSGKWDGNMTDFGAYGFANSPRQWNVRDVFDDTQAVTREDTRPGGSAGENVRLPNSLDAITRRGVEADRPNP